MKTKSEIIDRIDAKKTYIGSYVIERVQEVECDDTYLPSQIKRGDVLIVRNGAKQKARPSVVIKVFEDKCIVIPLTSTKNVHNLCESKSRFFGEGWFSNVYDVVTISHAKQVFAGVYDNPRLVNVAIKELKKFIEINLK